MNKPSEKTCLMYVDHGRYLDLYRPDPALLDIKDIAWSLQQLVRWTGRSSVSVLQHSRNVANLLPDHLKLQGLMHDAAGAFTGDVHSPLKKCLPELAEIEHALNTALAARFGYSYPFHQAVHVADRLVRRLEAQRVFRVPYESAPTSATLKHGHEDIGAFRSFLHEFRAYGGEP